MHGSATASNHPNVHLPIQRCLSHCRGHASALRQTWPSPVTALTMPGCQSARYCLSGASVSCSGALEIFINPVKGWLNSKIKKTAPDAEIAKIKRAATLIGLRRENKLKLANMIVSQNSNIIRNGKGIGSTLPSTNCMKRDCAISRKICMARFLRNCCASFRGDSSDILSKASSATAVGTYGVVVLDFEVSSCQIRSTNASTARRKYSRDSFVSGPISF
jgi:hypothetical protein